MAIVAILGTGSARERLQASSVDPGFKQSPGAYAPGRIENVYSLFLPGERESLQSPPTVSAVDPDHLTARCGGLSALMRPGDQLAGWRLMTIAVIDGTETAVFEKHATHRGAIAYVTAGGGTIAYVPKEIGRLSSIQPRAINAPNGEKFERAVKPGPDTAGDYVLGSNEDPCYENVAALGPEYVGWTLVANEEAGPQYSLYLDESGRSRQISPEAGSRALWAPDSVGPEFDPPRLVFRDHVDSFSKRTLLGGYLPVADLGVWSPAKQSGYETIVLLPPGAHPRPMAWIRATLSADQLARYEKMLKERPDLLRGTAIVREDDRVFLERYWNGTPQEFYAALAAIWSKWHAFHESGMQVDIPDEWLRDAALAGITLARCSYTGLEPSYQIGEGAYTRQIPSSHALFPVAEYEFIWAHQLWNHGASADRYYQHYLDHYILPNGDFVYNSQDQVEAPLNIGVFLENSARSYGYTRDLESFERRLPILERMAGFLLRRYEFSKTAFGPGDRRRGLIWGSPEADMGDPRRDTPEAHPFYYQNAAWAWRGLQQHAKALRQAAKDGRRKEFDLAAGRDEEIAGQMRREIEASLAATLSLGNAAMRSSGITPFSPDDVARDPTHLENYENHRMMEDWFLADWGDPALDLGHLKHRRLAGMQILGLGRSHEPSMTSNFMAHGTLSVLVRQDDYRPFLLSLYALACYAADSGNRYSPEDAIMPGGRPLEGSRFAWSAVVNSALQPALGLRWLLCYEEEDHDVCHLQKAAPRHWFARGRTIAVRNCPTRFGTIAWSTHALSNDEWQISVDLPAGFCADLVIHIHPDDGRPLRKASVGVLDGNKIIIHVGPPGGPKRLEILASS